MRLWAHLWSMCRHLHTVLLYSTSSVTRGSLDLCLLVTGAETIKMLVTCTFHSDMSF